MAIITIQGINHEKENKVQELFSKLLSFTGIERTRKYKEGRYILITKKV